MSPAPVVLVHGSFHDSRCWAATREHLELCGVHSVAPDLPGRGALSEVVPRLDRDVAVVEEELRALGGPAVVVAHGRGGQVITRLGPHPLIRHLVYVAAPMPDEGERASELVARVLTGSPLAEGLRFDGSRLGLDPDAAAQLFYPGCSEQQVVQGLALLVPEPLDPLDAQSAPEWDVCGDPAWRHRPSTYVQSKHDAAFPVSFQAEMATRARQTVDLDAGHAVFVSHSRELAQLVHTLATRAQPDDEAQPPPPDQE